jgi:hypothetical protein
MAQVIEHLPSMCKTMGGQGREGKGGEGRGGEEVYIPKNSTFSRD